VRKVWKVIDRDHYVAEAQLCDRRLDGNHHEVDIGTIIAEYTTDSKDAFRFRLLAVARCVAKALRAAEQEDGENAEHRVVAVTKVKKTKKSVTAREWAEDFRLPDMRKR
jgi:hypothetical protein